MSASSPATGDQSALPTHGGRRLPSVDVDSYSLELEDGDGFAGDKANKGAFVRILDQLRKPLRECGEDPLGSKPSAQISRKKLGALLAEGEPDEAAIVQSAIEDFAQQLTGVIGRFLKLKSWHETECIVIGGGFRSSRVGELAIARTNILLKTEDAGTELQLVQENPDEAGLIGAAHLLPAWMLEGYDAILAADIGGTNMRAGIVELNLSKARDFSKAHVDNLKHWCHKDEEDLTRNDAVERLVRMLTDVTGDAKKSSLRLAPVIGVACPGIIREDGSIASGAQNLPGNWASSKFNLPQVIRERIPRMGKHETTVVLHNDAVVQGLSEVPRMRDRSHWGILTIGSGLGNARFSNRSRAKSKSGD
jgi:predicted NBD/HSP70 family sugar kinase